MPVMLGVRAPIGLPVTVVVNQRPAMTLGMCLTVSVCSRARVCVCVFVICSVRCGSFPVHFKKDELGAFGVDAEKQVGRHSSRAADLQDLASPAHGGCASPPHSACVFCAKLMCSWPLPWIRCVDAIALGARDGGHR